MKQVININFHGRVVPIEVTAFDILKNYTDSLNRYFANEEGKEEIINDIESRVGELFQERLKNGATCITDDDVNAIIRSMGRPEDFETEETTSANTESAKSNTGSANTSFTTEMPRRLHRDENNKVFGGVCSGLANYFGIDVVVVRIIFIILGVSFGFGLITYLVLWVAVPSTATAVIGSVRKKLYRDSDDKIIAGVCSGIGNYFGINAWVPRVLFLIPFLSFVSRWGHWGGDGFPDFVRVSFSPGALIVYIILWLVIPEAFSTTEKLEMKGEKVDMNSIKNSVMEEMKGVQQRAEKFTGEAKTFVQEKSKTVGSEMGAVAKRGGRSLGDIIVLIFKVFAYFILGCIGFAFLVGLFALGISAIGLFPMKDFVLREGWQDVFAWGTLIFFITVPIIGIITWVVRKLAKVKSNSKTMRISFSALWIIGWFCVIALITSVSMDFRYPNNLREEAVALENPLVNKLEITSTSLERKYYRNNWFKVEPFENFDEDTAILKNVSVHIFKSPNDSFKVTMLKLVNGPSHQAADETASKMSYSVVQKDTLLVAADGIPITKQDKFRNQRIVLMVYVPVGKQIRINDNMGWGGDLQFGPWDNHDWNLGFRDQEEGWEHNKDYIMKADGLYELNGRPAATWKHPEWKDNDDDDDEDRDNIKTTQPDSVDGKAGVYRYQDAAPAKAQQKDTVPQQKNSVPEKKDTISTKTIKAGARVSSDVLNQTMSYTLPGYNPLLIMN